MESEPQALKARRTAVPAVTTWVCALSLKQAHDAHERAKTAIEARAVVASSAPCP